MCGGTGDRRRRRVPPRGSTVRRSRRRSPRRDRHRGPAGTLRSRRPARPGGLRLPRPVVGRPPAERATERDAAPPPPSAIPTTATSTVTRASRRDTIRCSSATTNRIIGGPRRWVGEGEVGVLEGDDVTFVTGAGFDRPAVDGSRCGWPARTPSRQRCGRSAPPTVPDLAARRATSISCANWCGCRATNLAIADLALLGVVSGSSGIVCSMFQYVWYVTSLASSSRMNPPRSPGASSTGGTADVELRSEGRSGRSDRRSRPVRQRANYIRLYSIRSACPSSRSG